MKRKIVLLFAVLAVLALCFCACDGTAPCKHEIAAVEAVAATCVDNGSIAYWKCAKCEKCFSDEKGETEITLESTVVAALEHDWQWVVDKEATETEQGVKHEQCSRCDEKRNENTVVEIVAHVHELAEVAAVEPTCVAEGNVQYWQCAGCEKIFADDKGETEIALENIVVAVKEHEYGDWAVVAEATCAAEGSEERVCAVCGAKETRAIAKIDHTPSKLIVDVEPTCTADGSCHNECTVCGEILLAEQVILAKGHVVSDWVIETEPTCAKAGSKYKKCTVCDEKLEVEEIAVLAHTEAVDAAVEPTCDKAGKTEGKHCSVCNVVLVAQNDVPALGHKWNDGEITTAPTCDQNGVKTFVCTVCNQLKMEKVAALGHVEMVDEAVDATCTAVGKTAGKHCSVCNAVFVAQAEIPALGHDWDDGAVTTEPTCTDKGVKTYKCARCEEIKLEAIEALGHKADDAVEEKRVEATCTEDGSYDAVVYCSVCKAELSRETNVVVALGHKEVVDVSVAATCTEAGLTEGKHCSVCEVVLVEQKEVAALGHKFVDRVCTACSEYDVSKGLELTLNADGTAYIVTGIGDCTDTDVIIPATYNGKPVTAIGAKAFENCTSLTSVTILNGMVSIAKDAFDGCENLAGIILK